VRSYLKNETHFKNWHSSLKLENEKFQSKHLSELWQFLEVPLGEKNFFFFFKVEYPMS
jgi:hypothetical protein